MSSNIDINECQNRTLCLQFPLKYCVNTQGSYFCQCMAGFENSTSGECIGKVKLHPNYRDLQPACFRYK